MERNLAPLYARELALQAFLCGIDGQAGLFAKGQPFNLNTAKQAALADALGVDFGDVAVVREDDPVDPFGLGRGCRHRLEINQLKDGAVRVGETHKTGPALIRKAEFLGL